MIEYIGYVKRSDRESRHPILIQEKIRRRLGADYEISC